MYNYLKAYSSGFFETIYRYYETFNMHHKTNFGSTNIGSITYCLKIRNGQFERNRELC